jgi:hypothetical protein
MRRFFVENSLSIFFLVLLLASLIGQSFAGQNVYNQEQVEHGSEAVSWMTYVLSPHFGSAVMENWQSEFLQFTTFIFATVWLIQRGSNESKTEDDAGLESDQAQLVYGYAKENSPRWAKVRGLRHHLYANSLLIAMTTIFFASWFAESLTSWRKFNAEQADHDSAAISYGDYLVNADFWEKSLQNWQSEFLAVGVMVVFTVYLRQRGSPESKPVGAPHAETGTSG